MNLGPTSDCRHCQARILVGRVRGGKYLPFNLEMIERTPDVVNAYVPVIETGAPGLVPIADVSDRRLDGVRWLATRHQCTGFLRSRATARDEVDSLAGALAEFFGVDLTAAA
jgi:hypothetical protein